MERAILERRRGCLRVVAVRLVLFELIVKSGENTEYLAHCYYIDTRWTFSTFLAYYCSVNLVDEAAENICFYF
jgi:hypothetical protein